MNYKQIRYLSLISIILGIFISYMLSNMMFNSGIAIIIEFEGYYHYQYYPLPEVQLIILYDIVLTIVVMVIIPILILRRKNPKKNY